MGLAKTVLFQEAVLLQEVLGDGLCRLTADLNAAVQLLQGHQIQLFEDRFSRVSISGCSFSTASRMIGAGW